MSAVMGKPVVTGRGKEGGIPAARHTPRWLAVLFVLVLLSALGVVYAKHQSRKLFVELHALQQARDELNVKWGQLRLEQSTWASQARVESMARARLGMTTVTPEFAVAP